MTSAQTTTVHLIFSAEGLRACEPRRLPTDPLVLIEDGVYALGAAQLGGSLWVLADDLALRGLDLQQLAGESKCCSYSDLVDLIARSHNVVSWH